VNHPASRVTVNKSIPAGRGLAPVLVRRAATVELAWDVRRSHQFECTDSRGRLLAVSLPSGVVTRGGDVLLTEDGSMVRVIAAPQPVLRVTHCPAHGAPLDLTRAAYLLGLRQAPVELTPGHLQIEPDSALARTLQSMHMIVTPVEAPFEPEPAASAPQERVTARAVGPWAHDQAYAHHDHAGCNHDH
jgi:urease accessory protein